MAIDAIDLPVLFRWAQDRAFAGDLLTLGRQDVTVSGDEAWRIASRCRFPLSGSSPGGGALTDVTLFRALGFADVWSLDADGYEGARIIHDLNTPTPPSGAEDRFDFVLDRGVSDIVFDFSACLSSIARMVRVGGHVIHFLPSSNHVETGYVMPSPNAFTAFYRANGFRLDTLWLIRQPWLDRWPTIDVYDYLDAGPRGLGGVRLDEAGYQIFFVAQRLPESTHDAIPAPPTVDAAEDTSARPRRPRLPRILRFAR